MDDKYHTSTYDGPMLDGDRSKCHDGFKIVSAMCDRYPPFATLINRIPLFPPRMKKEKKPTQMQAAFSINIAGAAKAHYFYHEFFF